MNLTPNAQRIHIAFFGKTNAGKSSIVNAFTGQELSVVSSIKGTTTDPVYKSMELLPLGAVTIIDTAGIDDDTQLGLLRLEKTKQVLIKADIAVLVVDSTIGISDYDEKLIAEFKDRNISYIIVYNKVDLLEKVPANTENEIYVSALKNTNIFELKELLATKYNSKANSAVLIKDLVSKNDNVIMVVPIDSSAPKGRIILPQQQVLRELLDVGAITTVVKDSELETVLKYINPSLVITDSQVFEKVNKVLPNNIKLTSFSILFARYKGVLKQAVKGINAIKKLKDNDTILISEGCTHHRQCEDIGTVKIPKWLKNYTGKNLNFEFTSGETFPTDLSKYTLIIHCGGCTLKDKEVLYRYNCATLAGVPIVNYGITIAYLHDILKRSIEIFPDIYTELD